MSVLDELRRLLSYRELRAFLAVYRGTRIAFTKTRTPSDEFVRVLGAAPAQRLADRFRGERIYVPTCDAELREDRNVEIRGRYAVGKSARSIARSYTETRRLTDAHVRRIAAGVKRETPTR
jgi:hypothetical protein